MKNILKSIFVLGLVAGAMVACDGEQGTFTDPRDGQTYKTVKIGDQVWMAQNLNYAFMEPITERDLCYSPDYSNFKEQAEYLKSRQKPYQDSSSFCLNDKPENCTTFGRLYTLRAAMLACPTGWHLPKTNEWEQLARHLDSNDPKLLLSKDYHGEDPYGFSAIPVGYRDFIYNQCTDHSTYGFTDQVSAIFDRALSKIDTIAFFWTASDELPKKDDYNSGKTDFATIGYSGFYYSNSNMSILMDPFNALSVRCVQDAQ